MVAIYSAYGLTLQADLTCPELAPGTGTPNAFLRYGRIPEELPPPSGGVAPYMLEVEGVAGYLVTGGEEILIQPAPGSLESDVRLWLFGSVFAALLSQRGMLALHASGIETPAGAVLFAGSSGAGKSTLAMALVKRGYRLLTDDVAGISLDEKGNSWVHPGIARSKLWADSLELLGLAPDGLEPLRPGAAKYGLPAHRDLARFAKPLKQIYVLDEGEHTVPVLDPLDRLQAVQVLLEQTYREVLLDILKTRAFHFDLITSIVSHAEVYRVKSPANKAAFDTFLDLLEENFPGAG